MAKSDQRDVSMTEDKKIIDPPERDTSLNIYQRIHAVMTEVDAIEPDKKHPVFKDKKKVGEFPYISHDAVTKKLQPLFSKHGIVTIPTIVKRVENGNRTELEVDVALVNIDAPEDRIVVHVLGHGSDNADKGPGKAISYAVKYALLKALMLNSGDDTGEDVTPHDPESARESDLAAAENARKDALKPRLETIKAAIKGAETVAGLNALWFANRDLIKSTNPETEEMITQEFAAKKARLEKLENEE